MNDSRVPWRRADRALTAGIGAGLALLLTMPLIVTNDTVFPYIVGKALFARGVIELLALLWVGLLLFGSGHRPPRSWVLAALFAYVAIAVLASVFGVSFTRSIWSSYVRMMGVWGLGHWLLLAVVAASVLRTPRAWRWLLNWGLAVALLLCLLAVAQAYRLPVLSSLREVCRLDATLGNAAYLAAILVVTTLVAVGFLARSFSPGQGDALRPVDGPEALARSGFRLRARFERYSVLAWRAYWGVVALLGVWVIFQTGTRGALVGLVGGSVAMPVALAVWGDRRSLLPVALGAVGVLLAIALLFVWDQTLGLAIDPRCQDRTLSARALPLLSGTTLVALLGAAVAVAASIALWVRGGKGRLVVLAVLGSVLFAGALFAWERTLGLPLTGEPSANAPFTEDASLATRVISARIGVRALREQPLLGWGPENYGSAFDRFVEPEAFVYGPSPGFWDQAHSAPIEELTTKGVLGLLSYVVLWGTLVWAIVRRRRPPGEEALAYGVLGALTAYFVQDLFLFDSPATLLQWAILVAWVAGQERVPESRIGVAEPPRTRPGVLAWVAMGSAVVLVGLSLFFFSYRPYAAAETFAEATSRRPLAEQLALFQQSTDTFSPLANRYAQSVFYSLARQWPMLSPPERQLALAFFGGAADDALAKEPSNPRLVASIVSLLQVAATSREALEAVEPHLERLREIAPQQVQTHQLMAKQQLLKGNYHEALSIAEAYEASAPGTERLFRDVTRVARALLASTGDAEG